MSDWRDKDDLDLTGDDIEEMLEVGQSLEASGPRLPAGATVVAAYDTIGSTTSLHPSVPSIGGPVRVRPSVTV